MKRPAKGRHILILVENWPVPPDKRAWDESRALAAAGYAVSVICRQAPDQPRHEEREGVRFHRYPAPPDPRRQLGYLYEYAYSWARAAALTIGIAVRQGFDAIQVNNPPDLYFTFAVPFKLLGKRFVLEIQDLSPELYGDRFERPCKLVLSVLHALERLSVAAADHVITPNAWFREIVLARDRKDAETVTAIYQGPDVERIRRRPPRAELKEGKPLLCCFVGAMDPQSHVDWALLAAHHLVHDLGRRDCHFAFLGDGVALPGARRLAGELALDPWVTFTGWAGEDLLLDYLSTADLGLAPEAKTPRLEISTSVKSLEYMAVGLPFVTFDLKEMRATAGGAALYAEGDDLVAYARLLDQLLDDPERRAAMGREGRRRIHEWLSWERQQTAYLRIYKQLLDGELVPAAGEGGATCATA